MSMNPKETETRDQGMLVRACYEEIITFPFIKNKATTVRGLEPRTERFGNDSLLISHILATDTILNQISAEEFPYLKLKFYRKIKPL